MQVLIAAGCTCGTVLRLLVGRWGERSMRVASPCSLLSSPLLALSSPAAPPYASSPSLSLSLSLSLALSCPHTAIYVPAYCYICVLILLYMRVGVCMRMGMGEEGLR